ncbi:hypothetical protein ACGF1Z_27310 [Streptomyces sp. NPDC048018]|uniref:hypothetical protein n=1 Tax=Streptomyces sp. NPDC048018 TaxID=3365499 RepID=UPI00370FD3D6
MPYLDPAGLVVLVLFALVALAGPYASRRFRPATRSTVPTMTDSSSDRSSPQSEPAQLHAIQDRLKDVLDDAPGRHVVSFELPSGLSVLSYQGPIVGLPGTESSDLATVGIIREALADAGITAEVEQCSANLAYPGIRTTLRDVGDADRLVRLVLDRMPQPILAARRLARVLAAHGCVYADRVEARAGRVWDLLLTLDDVRTVLGTLGESSEELSTYGAELYGLADRVAQVLQDRLGGKEIRISAFPSRGQLCSTCHEEILAVEPLSPEQAEALTAALVRTLPEPS